MERIVLFTTDDGVEVTNDNGSWSKFEFFLPIASGVATKWLDAVIEIRKKDPGQLVYISYTLAKQAVDEITPVLSLNDLRNCIGITEARLLAKSKLPK
jgi:hypothetical protein